MITEWSRDSSPSNKPRSENFGVCENSSVFLKVFFFFEKIKTKLRTEATCELISLNIIIPIYFTFRNQLNQQVSKMSEAEFDDESNSQDLFENEHHDRESDEDTEDASETDMVKNETEYMEIKEQIYQEKLSLLKEQLNQLNEGSHPEYVKKLKTIEYQYEERMFLNDAYLEVEKERIEQEYINEQEAAARDFEERKINLKESLIVDLEEKRKTIENERISLEFNSDSYESKPATTRKLRRRPNDPTPAPEKRKRGSPAQLNQLLEESDILDDLKIINHSAKWIIIL